MIRLDKYLANLWLVSRRNVGKYTDCILLNWEPVKKSDIKINYWDVITFDWNDIEVREKIYIILNKPKWYISSNLDEFWYLSYRHLLQDCPYVNLMNVAWRLDQDTEWLLLLTNDGDFIHKVISPKRKEEKEYYVEAELPLDDQSIEFLKEGVVLDDGYKTLPAKVERLTENTIKLTITEWKYHQVKRMLESVWNKVVYLRRDRIWSYNTIGLDLGKWKYINI